MHNCMVSHQDHFCCPSALGYSPGFLLILPINFFYAKVIHSWFLLLATKIVFGWCLLQKNKLKNKNSQSKWMITESVEEK